MSDSAKQGAAAIDNNRALPAALASARDAAAVVASVVPERFVSLERS